MKKQIEIDEELLNEANKVLDASYLDAETAVTMYLKRIVKEQSIAFMYPSAPHPSNLTAAPAAFSEKMTKNRAMRIFAEQGYKFKDNVTFASKNKSAYNYWANPEFDYLKNDWSLILNDGINRKLYLFHIPAGAIPQTTLVPRSDNPDRIDLQIMYTDPTFTDNRSKFAFKPFLVKEIDY